MYSKADLDHIRELKQTEPFTGSRGRTASGEECKFKFLGRGEMAFYQQGDRALLMEVLAGYGVIFAYSIRWWDNGKKVSPEERETVIEVVSRIMRERGAEEVKVVRK
jgi:hypothetical protein